MASNPLFIIPDFFLHFPNELCYGYLRSEGNGKFSFAKLRQPTGQTFFSIYPKEFSPFPSNLSSFGKCKEKPGIPFWGWTPYLFPSKNLLLRHIKTVSSCFKYVPSISFTSSMSFKKFGVCCIQIFLNPNINLKPFQISAKYDDASMSRKAGNFDWSAVFWLVEIEYCDFIGLKKCRRSKFPTPARTLSISGLKSWVLKLPFFNLKMMLKNGLDFFFFFWNPPSTFGDT